MSETEKFEHQLEILKNTIDTHQEFLSSTFLKQRLNDEEPLIINHNININTILKQLRKFSKYNLINVFYNKQYRNITIFIGEDHFINDNLPKENDVRFYMQYLSRKYRIKLLVEFTDLFININNINETCSHGDMILINEMKLNKNIKSIDIRDKLCISYGHEIINLTDSIRSQMYALLQIYNFANNDGLKPIIMESIADMLDNMYTYLLTNVKYRLIANKDKYIKQIQMSSTLDIVIKNYLIQHIEDIYQLLSDTFKDFAKFNRDIIDYFDDDDLENVIENMDDIFYGQLKKIIETIVFDISNKLNNCLTFSLIHNIKSETVNVVYNGYLHSIDYIKMLNDINKLKDDNNIIQLSI